MDGKSPRGELAASINAAPDATFDISRRDSSIIRSIVARAFRDDVLRPSLDFIQDPADARLTLTMDIEAVHANGNPLNLAKLLDTDDFTFRHDIAGIQKNVDRRSGRLRNFFTPRASMSAAERQAQADELAKATGHMRDLIAASEHAGAARAHLERAANANPNDGEGLKAKEQVDAQAKVASAKGAPGERAIPRKRSRPAAKKSAVATPAPRKPAPKKVVGKARKVVGSASKRRRR